MVFFQKDSIIYAKNNQMTRDEMKKYTDAVWYDGEFSFFDGEEREGFYKLFRWDGTKPIVEYKKLIEPEQEERTQLDRIEEAVLAKNADIAAAAVDEYTLQLMEGGIL